MSKASPSSPTPSDVYEAWPIGHKCLDSSGTCVPFPTKESLLRNAGETRGLIVMLAQALKKGECFFEMPKHDKLPIQVEASQVDYLAPTLV